MKKPDLERCAKLIRQSKRTAVLTGAGISTNAGIPDFRGPQGLYVSRRYDPDLIFDIHHFLKNPKPFYKFARDFMSMEATIAPTFTHGFLASLEARGMLHGIITQNIDSLHHTAGSKIVYEMHGSFWQSHCLLCHKRFNYQELKAQLMIEPVPMCPCGGVIKPDVVFFGENVKYYNESITLVEGADLLMVIGTSCAVYPAASLPTLVKGEIIIVNSTPVPLKVYNIALTVEDDIDTFFRHLSEVL